MALITQPSRKPGFWAEVDKLNRAESKAAKKAEPAEKINAKPAKKAAKKGKTACK
jgi:hypothetical protein